MAGSGGATGEHVDLDLTGVDLTDLDRFAHGFPHDVFAALRRQAPVWFHPPTAHTPGGEGFWVVATHAGCLAASSDAATFSSETGPGRDGGGGTLIEDLPGGFAAGVLLNMTDDPRHQQVRRLLTPAVSPRALARLEDELRVRTAAIVAAAAEAGECDLVLDVAAELPLQAIAHLLGVPQEDRHLLFGWATATLDYEGDRELGQDTDRTEAAAAAMFDYGTRLVEAKRSGGGAHEYDLLAAAVASTDPELSELELQMLFNLLVAAGSETTRNSIAGGVLAFTERPEEWERLRGDRTLLPTAVEEILRWTSATAYNRRTATTDVELGGQLIRAGQKTTHWYPAANRDATVFADPDRFDIGRDPNPHLAFGHGIHHCLGATLARLEIATMLEVLLDRCAGFESRGPVEWGRSNKHTAIRSAPLYLIAP